ncbi:MAG TPA: alcohol dehydrogenase catalytic domain-containing protein [Candidatus Limnocylindrales bacterium]
MRALLVSAPGSYRLAELPDPEPGPGEVLVAPACVGICGSDLEVLGGTRPDQYVHYPVVPGHEWSGTVVRCGPGTNGLAPGVPVVAEGVRSCGICHRCAEGRVNLCAGPYAETGFTHPGALAELLVVPAKLVHPLPPGRPLEAAALIEPAACVATGLLEVGMPPAGARLAVVGDGPLGLLAVALLNLSLPSRLALIGARRQRASYGKELGATEIWSRDDSLSHLESTFDLVLEATNSPEGAASALRLARRAGTVLLLGISGAARPSIDPDLITLKHLRVQGVFAASRPAWQWLVSLYSDGLFDPSTLITHRFPLSRFADAIGVLSDRDSGALKVVIQPS